MTSSRSAADQYSAAMLKKLKSEGKLAQPLDDDTARQLLKTPPTNLRSGGLSLPPLGGGASPVADGDTTAGATPATAALEGGASSLATHGGPTSPGPPAPPPLPPALAGATAAQQVEYLVEECNTFSQAIAANQKLSRDHMQRSLLQLFEDTYRDKLAPLAAGAGGRGKTSGGGGGGDPGAASLLAMSSSAAASPASQRSATKSFVGVKGVQSLRPVDRSGQLGSVQLDRRGPDALTDTVIPDAIRQQVAGDIAHVLDHELRRLAQLLLADVNRVVSHVRNLSDRMGKAEEALMHATVDNDVSKQRIEALTTRGAELEEELQGLAAQCDAKDRQADVLREQVQRRNTSLDDTRVRFRKESMRYKARIYELELELESAVGKGRVRKHIGNDAVPDSTFEAPEELTAAVEDAVFRVTELHKEELRKLQVDHAREKKALTIEMNCRVSERDHEIIDLRRRLKDSAINHQLAASNLRRSGRESVAYPSPSSNAPTPQPGGLDA